MNESEKSDELMERLVSFADRCLTLLQALPRNRIGVANFRDQLSRSSTAIAANYAEATAPESRRDFASKMSKALKEAKESRTWLFIISKRGFFAEKRMKPILDEINAIIRILGKGVSTTRRGIAEEKNPATPDDAGQCWTMADDADNSTARKWRPTERPAVVSGRSTPVRA